MRLILGSCLEAMEEDQTCLVSAPKHEPCSYDLVLTNPAYPHICLILEFTFCVRCNEGWKKCIKVGEYINNNNVIKSIVRIIQTERTNKGDKIFNLFNIS